MLKSVFSVFLILGLSGCILTESGEGISLDGQKRRPSKPLPDICMDDVDTTFRWVLDHYAFSYDLAWGVVGNAPAVEITLNSERTSYSEELPRGYQYFVRVLKRTTRGGNKTLYAEFYVPTCEERRDWQLANPDYSEPIVLDLDQVQDR